MATDTCLPADVELVLFDMAGTTVDDDVDGMPLVIAAFRATFKAYDGSEVSLDNANAVRGYEKKEALRRLLCSQRGLAEGTADEAEVDSLFAIFKVELDKLTANMKKEIAGTTETFSILREHGIRICVGSGFPAKVVESIVEAMGWTVDCAFSSEALGAGRPDPVMVKAAMEKCSISDSRKVVKVGDTVVDIEEGKNGGAWTVAVLTGTQSREKLAAASPDCIIESVADLPKLFQWPKL
uniref:Phosphonoacetaldehyde hydrolase n=1 Tax=Karlodinium veneficum TaxID=407301 RepID=A0A0F6PPR7_KARVE|nr:phosphonoacetaldehyde hydrolase [Karlodinium veneficum]